MYILPSFQPESSLFFKVTHERFQTVSWPSESMLHGLSVQQGRQEEHGVPNDSGARFKKTSRALLSMKSVHYMENKTLAVPLIHTHAVH